MKPPDTLPVIESDIPLSGLTTIGLGGKARSFAVCRTVNQIRQALLYAREHEMQVQVLGGGSNVIFGDEDYPGLVLKIALRGISVYAGTPYTVRAAAGEIWDNFVTFCVDYDLSGIECLSGIPGLVGAAPMQNIGAYGQEVADTILSVKAIDRKTLGMVELTAVNCWFGYRKSRFKAEDVGRYVITEVAFRLQHSERPVIRYPDLQEALTTESATLEPGRPGLMTVRNAVLALRRKKSMLVDPGNPHARSVGSFFVNPVLTLKEFSSLQTEWVKAGHTDAIPAFPAHKGIKVSAAWLVERAGFPKGFRHNGVGVSPDHALALVNYGGTTRELLAFADEIRQAVDRLFGIRLEPEPVIIAPGLTV